MTVRPDTRSDDVERASGPLVVPSDVHAPELRELLELGRRQAFLLEASAVLGGSLDYEAALGALARLLVPRIADWCVIEIAGTQAGNGHGGGVPLAVAHADPDQIERVVELWQLVAATGIAPASTGDGAALLAQFTDEELRALRRDDAQLQLLQEVGLRSLLRVSIKTGERTLGAIILAGSSAARAFDERDLAMAEDLARRAADCIEHGRAYLLARSQIALREDLMSIVAHDLRNPLAGMLMRCSLLLETLPQDEFGAGVRRDVEAMRRSAHRIESLLRDTLDFARIQAGRLSLERQPLSVDELLREALDAVPPLAGKRTLQVESIAANPDARLRCDRERFLQIFSNLVSNAIKFSKPTGTIGIRCELAEQELRVWVRDDGAGIAAEDLPHLFQKFWQKRAQRGGVGLGLSITKALVEAQGGRIWVESAAGGGSTFGFALPLAGGEVAVSDAAGVAILVVDDDAVFRRELVDVLRAHGLRAEQAGDGEQALAYLRTHARPAFILLDLMMPVMDGWQFAATLRSQAGLAEIPVVAMSGLEREAVSAPLLGFASYLRKPPRLEQLLELAARHRG